MTQQLKTRPRCPICGQLMIRCDRNPNLATDDEFVCMCLDIECLEFGIYMRVPGDR